MNTTIVERVRQRPSSWRTSPANDLELTLAHAVGIRCVRSGINTPDIAAAFAAYRERILARLEQGGELDEILRDVRSGRLATASPT